MLLFLKRYDGSLGSGHPDKTVITILLCSLTIVSIMTYLTEKKLTEEKKNLFCVKVLKDMLFVPSTTSYVCFGDRRSYDF